MLGASEWFFDYSYKLTAEHKERCDRNYINRKNNSFEWR